MPSPIVVPPLAARLFQLRSLGLERPFADIASALEHLGYVQIDPLNICGRMHDLILRNRVVGYREDDLMRHLHEDDDGEPSPGAPDRSEPGSSRAGHNEAVSSRRGPRSRPNVATGVAPRPRLKPAADRIAFEHHHPETNVLVAFPLDAWPHLLGAMRARSHRTGAWSGRLTPTERALAPRLLAEIEQGGPLSSEDFDDDRKAHRVVWGAATLVKSTLQKLFFHGRLLIAERHKNRRRYDLPERVLPGRILALPEAPAVETLRWIALLKLRQRRLVTLKRDELRAVSDAVQPVTVENCPPLYCLNEDVPLLQACVDDGRASVLQTPATIPSRRLQDRRPTTDPVQSATAATTKPMAAQTRTAAAGAGDPGSRSGTTATADPVQLLAPLDPLIYDRRVTARLWHFDYTWEAYTPAHKRVRGHYALPVLAGTELVGHVEPKADRVRGTLVVTSRSVRRGYRVGPALDALAAWLGLRR